MFMIRSQLETSMQNQFLRYDLASSFRKRMLKDWNGDRALKTVENKAPVNINTEGRAGRPLLSVCLPLF